MYCKSSYHVQYIKTFFTHSYIPIIHTVIFTSLYDTHLILKLHFTVNTVYLAKSFSLYFSFYTLNKTNIEAKFTLLSFYLTFVVIYNNTGTSRLYMK